MWGSAQAMKAMEHKSTLPNVPADLDDKVYNRATHSYVDKDLYDQSKQKERISANPSPKN